MKGLVIGTGEVGKAIFNVLFDGGKEIYKRDIDEPQGIPDTYDIIHICFPHLLEGFTLLVHKYILKYKPEWCIIHSTIPPGTTKTIQDMVSDCIVIHSPVNGIHPHLEEGLKTFEKFMGTVPTEDTKNVVDVSKVKKYFEDCGMLTFWTDSASTELGKIGLTTNFGWNLIFEKEFKALCERHGANFVVAYKLFIDSYNRGYAKLGYPQYTLPIYEHMEGPIGGHCLIPNCHLLTTYLTNEMIRKNEELLKGEQ